MIWKLIYLKNNLYTAASYRVHCIHKKTNYNLLNKKVNNNCLTLTV